MKNTTIVLRSELKYRPDIDGLRAIAVLAVIGFHLGISLAPGGFIGVDIFFVISGYLITQILATEIDSNSFSLANFYARRIRRIIPALFAMLVIISIFSYAIIIPIDYEKFANSAAAAALSVSNVYFYSHNGYFDLATKWLPLQHTWSLGIEEQFYLAFPIIFALLRKRIGLSWRQIVLTFFIISFVLGMIQAELDIRALLSGRFKAQTINNGAFYLPVSRSWEFLTGSAIATKIIPQFPRTYAVRNTLSILGFITLLSSIIFLNEYVRFPQFAILPCIASATIIHANDNYNTISRKILSTPILVGIGLISYSLYLWHWPLIVFANFMWGSSRSTLGSASLLLAIFLMAYLSWRFIERTVRINQQLFTRRRLFIATGIGASIFAGWAVLVTKLEGLPTRFSPAALVIADGAEDRNPNTDICDGKSGSEITAGPVCTIGQRIAPITFALIGDSYANALSPGVGDAASKAGRRGLVMTHSGCYALIGINWGSSDPDCKEFLHAAIQKLKATPSINTVILISRWTVAAEGTRFSADHPDRLFIVDDQSKEQGYDENKAVFTRSLKRDANALAGYKVFVLGFVPEQLMYISQSGAMRTQLGLRPDDVVTPRQTVEQRQADIRQLLSAASVQYGFRILDAMAPLCDDKMCHAIENGKSLYTDDNHLSRYGALMESTVLQSAFN